MKHQYTVDSIDDLCTLIKNIIAEEKTTLWYRGHSNAEWDIVPSIQRKNYKEKERVITHSFYHAASQISNNELKYTSYDKWVAKMQHYGIPTRLLDWSYSPLVALFFATNDADFECKKDACIWILLPNKLNEIQNFGPYIYPIDSHTAEEMIKPAFVENNIDITLDNKILACFSTNNDLRMYSQQAAFTIHNTNKKLVDYEQVLYKIIIPFYKLDYFKTTTNILGITEKLVFPDLEHIAKDVLCRYTN